MKEIVLFYSFTGKTKALAEKKAKERKARIEEITEVNKPSIIGAYTIGCFKALRRKKAEIRPIKAQLKSYDKIIIMTPIWAGHPTPVVNSLIELLPSGKKIELIMVSGGGNSQGSAEATKALITAHGCDLVGYTDVKGSTFS